MKASFLFAFTLISQLTFAQPLQPLPTVILPSSCNSSCSNLNPIGDPETPDDCSIGIERYLSRTIAMPNLANYNNDNLNGLTNCDSANNYTSTNWFHDYCPEKYCELINALPKLDAQLIQAAYFAGGTHEQELYYETQWYKVGRQLVVDINYAYDCAGKRRPIIQGFIGEIFDPNNVIANYNEQWYPIPPELIAKYFEYYPEDLTQEATDYYLSGDTVYFDVKNMANEENDLGGNFTWVLDISKIEMRMWFLYQAITLIDFGYKSIHMGLYPIYADHTTDPNYEQLYNLTNSFRRYASESGTFVLLSGESPMGNVDNGLSAKLAGTDRLIFDFDTRALRPREISNPQVSGDGGVLVDGQLEAVCTDPIPADILAAFNQSPCFGEQYPAIVNPCTINNFGGSSGGIAPALDGSGNSTCYFEQVPYIASLDGFNPPIVHSASGGPSSNVWGFDDHTWFSQLGNECREWWFNYFYCNRRDYMGGHGFLSIPGINMISDAVGPGGKRLISDDTVFLNSIVAGLLPDNNPKIEIKENCIFTDSECQCECNGVIISPGRKYRVGQKVYTINVIHSDCSSVYSIQLKDPNGDLLPLKVGDSYDFQPQIDGFYEIIARQDNIGLLNSPSGTKEIFKSAYLIKNCCTDQICSDPCDNWGVTDKCCPENTYFDSQSCYYGHIPDGYTGYVTNNTFYVYPNAVGGCPPGYAPEIVNVDNNNVPLCNSGIHIPQVHPGSVDDPDHYRGFIFEKGFYVEPDCEDFRDCCPFNYEFNGNNCFSKVTFNNDWQPFVYQGSFYVVPHYDQNHNAVCPDPMTNPGDPSSPHGWTFDGSNCHSGVYFNAPFEGIIEDGGFYVKPYCADEGDCCPPGTIINEAGGNCLFGYGPEGYGIGRVIGNQYYFEAPANCGPGQTTPCCPDGYSEFIYEEKKYCYYPDIEIPSNFSGFTYGELDTNGNGRLSLYVIKNCPQDKCCPDNANYVDPNVSDPNIAGKCWYGNIPPAWFQNTAPEDNRFVIYLVSENECLDHKFQWDEQKDYCYIDVPQALSNSMEIIGESMYSHAFPTCKIHLTGVPDSRSEQEIELNHTKDSTLKFTNAISIFPNPASNMLNIRFNADFSGPAVMKIFDLKGQLLESTTILAPGKGSTLTLFLNKILPGNYFLNLSSAGNNETHYFIKM